MPFLLCPSPHCLAQISHTVAFDSIRTHLWPVTAPYEIHFSYMSRVRCDTYFFFVNRFVLVGEWFKIIRFHQDFTQIPKRALAFAVLFRFNNNHEQLWAKELGEAPIWFRLCQNWHLGRAPGHRLTSGQRGGENSIFEPFSGDFVTCLKDLYMPSVTCDQYEKNRKFLGLWPVTYELN